MKGDDQSFEGDEKTRLADEVVAEDVLHRGGQVGVEAHELQCERCLAAAQARRRTLHRRRGDFPVHLGNTA